MTQKVPTVTVVICAYTERRWDQIVGAVDSVRRQSHPPEQLVLVIDHNVDLLHKASTEFDDCDVVPNTDERGLSGARNVGVHHARAEVVAFLDDDACAEPSWLEALVTPYHDADVVGTGGVARAAWPGDRPPWFPPEFDWVVGCSYKGLPEVEQPVRNPIGANMSYRRSAFETAGGFQSVFGRMGTLPLGCEETEFSIRLRRLVPESRIVYVPGAVVDHFVSIDRTATGYFMRRCVAEGVSKAIVTAHVGNVAGLSSERQYTTRVLPRGFLGGLIPGAHDDQTSFTRSCMIAAGLLATAFGYVLGRLRLQRVATVLAAAPTATRRASSR